MVFSANAHEGIEEEIEDYMHKMQILEGEAFAPHEFESVPDYFILYYSASW